jgi:hypothetical protein
MLGKTKAFNLVVDGSEEEADVEKIRQHFHVEIKKLKPTESEFDAEFPK